jgi:hypothetical protein
VEVLNHLLHLLDFLFFLLKLDSFVAQLEHLQVAGALALEHGIAVFELHLSLVEEVVDAHFLLVLDHHFEFFIHLHLPFVLELLPPTCTLSLTKSILEHFCMDLASLGLGLDIVFVQKGEWLPLRVNHVRSGLGSVEVLFKVGLLLNLNFLHS